MTPGSRARGCALALLLTGCSAGSDTKRLIDLGAGGDSNDSGAFAGGTTSATGGDGNGGLPNTGGFEDTGGSVSNGGFPGTGGEPATGGAFSTGGTLSTGGSVTGVDPGAGETGRMVGMTAAHNQVRAGVITPVPIPDVTWSPAIASVAQAYADQRAATGCRPLQHSQNPDYGENLAWFGNGGTAEATVGLWAGEAACYTYGALKVSDACSCSACGHYTQLVWRDTTQIGCGVASCIDGGEIWVCNYAPPGNYLGEYPY